MITIVFVETPKTAEPKKEEKKFPKYIVPTSNFGCCSEDDAYISGIPCEVVSDRYEKTEKTCLGLKPIKRNYFDVVSLVTGIKYSVPDSGFYIGYDSAEDAVKNSLIANRIPMLIKSPKTIIGLRYFVKDNSWISDFNGQHAFLIGKPCTVVSLPFDGVVSLGNGNVGVKKFILVECFGKVYRTLFGEWNLYPEGAF